jgi:hypothetical protein
LPPRRGAGRAEASRPQASQPGSEGRRNTPSLTPDPPFPSCTRFPFREADTDIANPQSGPSRAHAGLAVPRGPLQAQRITDPQAHSAPALAATRRLELRSRRGSLSRPAPRKAMELSSPPQEGGPKPASRAQPRHSPVFARHRAPNWAGAGPESRSPAGACATTWASASHGRGEARGQAVHEPPEDGLGPPT